MCADLTIISSRPAELDGHLVLQRGQLDQVSVPLGAEVDAVCVGDQLDRTARQPEIEQADARDIAGVGVRLKRGDGGRAGGRVPAQPVNDPGHLVAAGVLVIEDPGGVTVCPAQRGDLAVIGEVGVHPGQPLRLGVAGDELIAWVGRLDGQRHQRYLADRQAVVAAGDAVGQDPPGDSEPRRSEGVRVQDLRPVAREINGHDRIVCTRPLSRTSSAVREPLWACWSRPDLRPARDAASRQRAVGA
jgi:hypothetical protein